MATKRILLTQKWSGHEAGEIVTEEDFTVDSMVRKGYGQEIPEASKPKATSRPPIETAMRTPPSETATTGPQESKHKPKNVVPAAKGSDVTPQKKES